MEPSTEALNSFDKNGSDFSFSKKEYVSDCSDLTVSNNLNNIGLLDHITSNENNEKESKPDLTLSIKTELPPTNPEYGNTREIDSTSNTLDWSSNIHSFTLPMKNEFEKIMNSTYSPALTCESSFSPHNSVTEIDYSDQQSFEWVKNINFSNVKKEINSKFESIINDQTEDLNNLIEINSNNSRKDKIIFNIKDEQGTRQKFEAISSSGGRSISDGLNDFSNLNDWLNYVKNISSYITTPRPVLPDEEMLDHNETNRNFDAIDFDISYLDEQSSENQELFFSQPFSNSDIINDETNYNDFFSRSSDNFELTQMDFDTNTSTQNEIFKDANNLYPKSEIEIFPTPIWDSIDSIVTNEKVCEDDDNTDKQLQSSS